MRNDILDRHVRGDRERFIHAIDEETICRLASSYHKNKPCHIFKELSHGSYNLCFYVAFSPLGGEAKVDRWVVRVPILPAVAFVDEKLEAEIATMRYVAEKTTIPIPQIHGYSFQRDSPIGIAFVIIDYIDGRTLQDIGLHTLSTGKRKHVYEQLADIAIQLRRQEFPHVGALSIPASGVGWTFEVPRRPLSIEVNGQEVEGLHASRIVEIQEVYTSTRSYISSLMRLAFNQFETGQNSVYNEHDARVALYNLHQFQEVTKTWVDPILDSGPFVLLHGDLRPPNLLLNEQLDIVAVIDWEWSRVVPLQLFIPPTWLTGREVGGLCSCIGYEEYVEELDTFRRIVADREMLYDGWPLLSKLWSKIGKKGIFLVAAALNNPALIDTVYSGYLDLRRHYRSNLNARVDEFMRNSKDRQTLVERKLRDRKSYMEEIELLNLANQDTSEQLPPTTGISRCFVRLNGFYELIVLRLGHVLSDLDTHFKTRAHANRARITIGILTLAATTYWIGRRGLKRFTFH